MGSTFPTGSSETFFLRTPFCRICHVSSPNPIFFIRRLIRKCINPNCLLYIWWLITLLHSYHTTICATGAWDILSLVCSSTTIHLSSFFHCVVSEFLITVFSEQGHGFPILFKTPFLSDFLLLSVYELFSLTSGPDNCSLAAGLMPLVHIYFPRPLNLAWHMLSFQIAVCTRIDSLRTDML